MSRILFFLTAALFLSPVAGFAAGSSGGSGTSSSAPGSSEFANAMTLIEMRKFGAAIPVLEKAVEAQPKNPDYLTQLAYAHRKVGEFDAAYKYYDMALTIDPEHKGALNYLGILYVQTDQIDKANDMLARLDDACFFGCDEYDSLKAAIAGDSSRY